MVVFSRSNLLSSSYCSFHCDAASNAKGFDSDGRETRSQRVVARGKANSKVNDVDFGRDEEGNGDEDEELLDWEKEMWRRVKEIEERKELEKKAEELQNRIEEDYGDDGREPTEEEKRTRVRKELEKDSEVFAASRTLLQEEEAHEIHCSRERSRAAGKIIEEHLMPFVEKERYVISSKCRLHSDNDLFRDQERHKIHLDINEWQCGYCKKSFHAENFLD